MMVIFGIIMVILVSEMGVFFHPKSCRDHSFLLLAGFLALDLFGLLGTDVSGALGVLVMLGALVGVFGTGVYFFRRYQLVYETGSSEYLRAVSAIWGVLLGCMIASHFVLGLSPELAEVMAGVISVSFVGTCYFFGLRLRGAYLRKHVSRSLGLMLGGGMLFWGANWIYSFGADSSFLTVYVGLSFLSLPLVRCLGQAVVARFLYAPSFFRREKGLLKVVKSLRYNVQASSIDHSISVLLPEVLGGCRVRYFLDMGDGQDFAFQSETGFLLYENLPKSSAFFELFSSDFGPVSFATFETVFAERSPAILKQVRLEFERCGCDVVLPLYGRADRVIGILMIDGPRRGWRFAVEILDLFRELGAVLSSIAETNYFYRRFSLQQHRLKSLGDLSLVLGSSFEVDHMLLRAGSFLRSEYNGRGVVAFLRRGKDDFFASYYSHLSSLPEALWTLDLESLGHDFSGSEGIFIYSMNSNQDSVLGRICSFYDAEGALVVPIGEKGNFDGVMVMVLDNIHLGLSVTDRMILQGFTRLVGAQYRNSLLFQDVRKAQVYHEDVLKQLAAGIVICDEADVIMEINLMAQRLFGVKEAEVVGVSVSCLSVFSSQETVLILSSLDVGASEICVRDGDQIRYCSVIREDHARGSLYVISDITELHYLQRETHRVSRLRSLGTMAAGIAHEIRNPLVPIKTFTQLLGKQWEDKVFLERYRGMVLPQLSRIRTMCDSLRRLGDESVPDFSEICLKTVLKNVVDLLSQDGRADGVLFHLDAPDLPLIWGDSDRLCQVFLNLCLNGIESLPDQAGKLWIKVREFEEKGQVEVSIKDNGCGMSQEAQTRLFDPFYTQKVSGTGLGMSIVHKICEEHSAGIRVFSKEGSGTEFVLAFPQGKNV